MENQKTVSGLGKSRRSRPKYYKSKLDDIGPAIKRLLEKGYSFRDISRICKERGFPIAHSTIWYWWKNHGNGVVSPLTGKPAQ